MLGDIAKNAGATATENIEKTVSEAIPAAGTVIQNAEHTAGTEARQTLQSAIFGGAGLIADIANRLDGAELPIDVTLTLTLKGKIGPFKLSNPVGDPTTQPSIVVQG